MIFLIGIAVAYIYIALLYASGPAKTAAEPIGPIREPRLGRNLTLGAIVFVLLDGVVFHSGIYQSVLEPKSNAGRVTALVRKEKQRQPSGAREILVLGDSRMGVGFSADAANALAAPHDITFINCSMAESVPRLWYYLLREIDPTASRYRAIVMPLQVDPGDARTALVNITQTAPLLRYTDALHFASSFNSWPTQTRAFMACLLRGSAFQADLCDFLEHPRRRLSHLRRPPPVRQSRSIGVRGLRDLVGIEYDAAAHELKVPEGFSTRRKDTIHKSIQRTEELVRSVNDANNCYDWTKRIVERYDASASSVVLLQLPKGPWGIGRDNPDAAQKRTADAFRGHKVILFDPDQFAFLEQPAYYMDAFHLNGKGQEQFTQRLTQDLLAQFALRDSAQAQNAAGAPALER